MNEELKVGNIKAEKGEKIFGKIKVTELADGSPVEVPVAIINGIGDGPVLYTQSACHGVEINGTEAIRRVIGELNPNKMQGALIAIPIVNILAARHRLGHTPETLDSLYGNMNRTWPGNPDGTLTERMSYMLFEEAVKKADYVIDHHTGEMPTLMCWIYFYEGIKEQENLAKVYGAEYLIAEKAGTEEWKKKRFFGKLRVVCHEQLKIPAICPELDGRDHLEEDAIQIAIRGIKNVMKHIGIIEGEPILPKKQYILSNTELGHVKANKGGWFLPEVKVGKKVNKGDSIGKLFNILDGFNEIDLLKAPRDGIVHNINKSPVVWPGVSVARVEAIVEEITNS